MPGRPHQKKKSEESNSSLLLPRSRAVSRLGSFGRRHVDGVRDRSVERRHEQRTLAIELGALALRDRVTALLVQRHAGIAVHTVHQNLEVEVRSGGQTGGSDVGDRLRDRHASTATDAPGKAAQVSVSRDESIAMEDLAHVAIAALASGEQNDTVADRAHGRALPGRVVDPLMTAHRPEKRMTSPAAAAGNAAKGDRRAQEGGTKRPTVLIEVVTADTRACITTRLDRLA